MKKTNKILIIVICLAIILLGIGYASLQNVTLNIAGKSTAFMTLAQLTNENIGDKIYLQDNRNWRVFYVDAASSTVYVILDGAGSSQSANSVQEMIKILTMPYNNYNRNT